MKIISPKSTAHLTVPWPMCTCVRANTLLTRLPVRLPRRCKHLPQTSPNHHMGSPGPRIRCWRRNGKAGAQLEACPRTHSAQALCTGLSMCCPRQRRAGFWGKTCNIKYRLFSCWAKSTWKVGGI